MPSHRRRHLRLSGPAPAGYPERDARPADTRLHPFPMSQPCFILCIVPAATELVRRAHMTPASFMSQTVGARMHISRNPLPRKPCFFTARYLPEGAATLTARMGEVRSAVASCSEAHNPPLHIRQSNCRHAQVGSRFDCRSLATAPSSYSR